MKIINVIVVYGDRVHRVKSFPILDIAREEVAKDIEKQAEDCFVETVAKYSTLIEKEIRECVLPNKEYCGFYTNSRTVSVHLVNSEVVN